ncbi:hypothetical protein BU23DRAFT_117908 [Bimuria novae-zelandiae CBS 107.79]|uniref:Uncharacterized protein n=1 Tax=Bimuria novae-zelandiae CBS 107.79 TaxID=1447943 RepID=A0A6A5V9P3_9PLEO|nr:hypothetical protein BU23DRAFT_117908 [Bimuria novae-zelandiae CBS 107.79]
MGVCGERFHAAELCWLADELGLQHCKYEGAFNEYEKVFHEKMRNQSQEKSAQTTESDAKDQVPFRELTNGAGFAWPLVEVQAFLHRVDSKDPLLDWNPDMEKLESYFPTPTDEAALREQFSKLRCGNQAEGAMNGCAKGQEGSFEAAFQKRYAADRNIVQALLRSTYQQPTYQDRKHYQGQMDDHNRVHPCSPIADCQITYPQCFFYNPASFRAFWIDPRRCADRVGGGFAFDARILPQFPGEHSDRPL